jgi:hypothetical protein
MQRSLGMLVTLLGLLGLLAIACGGGGTDKPPLTPDDPAANALDAGDVPPTGAVPPASTSAN